MKRLVIGMLVLLAASAALITYLDASESQLQRIEQAGSVGTPFSIPTDPRLSDPDAVLRMMSTSAAAAHVNVLRTLVGYTADGRRATTMFVLLASDTHAFDAFALRSGRWLGPQDAAYPDRYLAAAADGGPDQVGVLNVFGIQPEVSIRSMKRSFDAMPVSGTYFVEAPDDTSRTAFLTSLASQASTLAGRPGTYSAATFTESAFGGPQGAASGGPAVFLGGIQVLIVLLTSIFLAFGVLRDTKRAGVMRLHGAGALTVWYVLVGRRMLLTLVAIEAIALPAALVTPGAAPAFAVAVSAGIARSFMFALVASLVTCGYVARANIASAIKNRKDTEGLFALNTLVKAAATALLIAALSGVSVLFSDAASARSQFGNWDRARGFGVFTPRKIGNDFAEIVSGGSGTDAALVFDLYPALDSRGAVYVDSTEFEPQPGQSQPAEGDASTPDFPVMTVNVNYLHSFPVLDAQGHPVAVSEDTAEWVVLVPNGLRDREQQIRERMKVLRAAAASWQATMGRPVPPAVTDQKVLIIWTADGQAVFGFNPLVNPDAGGNIPDPIVQVMTRANSVGADRGNMMSGAIDSALKIPLGGADPASTKAQLDPMLRALRLDDNFPYLVTLDGWVSQQVAAIDTAVQVYGWVAVGLLAGLLVLSVQGVVIMVERYARRIAVRQLFGASFIETYREVVLLFIVLWGAQLCAAIIVNRLGVNPFAGAPSTTVASAVAAAPDIVVIAITAAVALAEWLLTVAVLTRTQQVSLVRVIKEEF